MLTAQTTVTTVAPSSRPTRKRKNTFASKTEFSTDDGDEASEPTPGPAKKAKTTRVRGRGRGRGRGGATVTASLKQEKKEAVEEQLAEEVGRPGTFFFANQVR